MGSALGQSVRTRFVPAAGVGRSAGSGSLMRGHAGGGGARPSPSHAVMQVVPRLDPDETGRSTLDVARALAGAGWRAAVATGGGPLERDLAMLSGAASGAKVATTLLPLDAAGPLAGWRNARLLARAAKAERASLLHGRGFAAAEVTADAARRAGLPFMLTLHELPPEATAGRRAARLRRALGEAGLVVATSEHAAERLVAGDWAESTRLRVVPRWIDLVELDPDRVRGHRVAAAAERCGLSVGPKVVAVPAEVAAGDGCQLLVEALSRLERQDYRLLLLGPLPAASGRDGTRRLTERLGEAGLGERVRFGTDLADLAGTLALVDVLLVPATRPRASARLVAAAQAMGRPVIVTTAGALGEAVMPAVTGWLLPPDDPGEIAWALDLALRMDEDVRDRVARRAREFAAETFAAPVMLERKLSLYRELLAGPRPMAVAPPGSAVAVD